MNPLIQKTDSFLEKARIYLKEGEKPPEGVRLQRGSRNGLFYESETNSRSDKISGQMKAPSINRYGFVESVNVPKTSSVARSAVASAIAKRNSHYNLPNDWEPFDGVVPGVKTNKNSLCYQNSIDYANATGSRLVVGIAFSKDSLVDNGKGWYPDDEIHAWNLDEKGRVIDTTWGSTEAGRNFHYGKIVDPKQFTASSLRTYAQTAAAKTDAQSLASLELSREWKNQMSDKEKAQYGSLFKAKVYVQNANEAPNGVAVLEGDRGGLYYNSSSKSSPKNTTSAHKPGTSVTSVKEPSSPRRSNLMASWSQRYTSPSYLKSFEDDPNLSLHSYYTKISEVAKKDLQNAIEHIREATGYTPKARIKDTEKILAKAERYKNQGKDPKDIWDVLGTRIIAEDEAKIPGLIKKVMENFPVSEVENWYEKKNDWGYKGVNIRLKLPNGLKAELQIHTEDSALKSVALHGIYDRWKNTVLTQNNTHMFEQDLHNFQRLVSLPLEEFRAQMDPQTLQMAESLLKSLQEVQRSKIPLDVMLKKSREDYLINSFLNGYKHLALLGLDYPSERLPDLLEQARQVAINKGYTNIPSVQDGDRLGAVIAVDQIAHELHKRKHEDGSSDYPILDKIAEISKAIGEEDDRDNRLLYLSKSAPVDIKTLDHIEILTDIQKGIPLEQGEGYWALLEKAIKLGCEKLTSKELVLLREFAFARLM